MKHLATKVLHNWNDRFWWRKVAFPYAARKVHNYLPHHGLYLPDEDWDNLLILDACRYDMFAEQSTLSGDLSKRTSAASNTPEFLQHNFKGGDFSDTVYVTANPQVNVHLSDEFFEVINVWEDHWNDELNTVMPEVMAEETIAAYKSYPNKRLISHFIQPHYPFIGETGQKELNTHSGMELSKRLATNDEATRDQLSIWDQLYEGSASVDLVWKAYRENLDVTIPHVKRVIDVFQEYTVVTSDHGNALGERAWPVPNKIYGHPPGIRIPALTDVPWLVTNTKRRKEIEAGDSSSANISHEEAVSQRLADLGYK
ncbi:hypothetical protein [Halobacterium salinarum]|uniref:hypothetical protein n=1 Tax=Halobacterium salinarum TaxID=2242 RepID=UPI00255677A4|nr:hypothetical protein [Halobacterium salinarum]MDL0132507.1 hypothetical protein [Halobacterium salinarum]